MRVLTFVPNQTGHSPGQRSNIEIWESALRADGIELVFEPFETPKLNEVLYKKGHNLTKAVEMLNGYRKRFDQLRHVDDFDAVYVFREAALLGPAFFERMIAKRKPLIYHFDDPIFVPYKSRSNGYLSYLKFFGKVKKIISMASVVIVNSLHLRDYALQFNKNVKRITNSFDSRIYSFKPFPEKLKRVCIGWSGSSTTLKNLKLVERPLQMLSAANICDIHFIGGRDVGLKNIKYTAQNWLAETEVDDLRKMQVGLVPLPANEWNRYKFIMKTPQYMALGIVPVGTPLASNPEVIRHGENGFLADTDEEWIEYLELLVHDHSLRNRMSAEAAKDAKAKYSLAANTPKVIKAFRSAKCAPR